MLLLKIVKIGEIIIRRWKGKESIGNVGNGILFSFYEMVILLFLIIWNIILSKISKMKL